MWLPEYAPWLDEFIAEHLQFPKGEADDQVDAMSQMLNYLMGHSRKRANRGVRMYTAYPREIQTGVVHV